MTPHYLMHKFACAWIDAGFTKAWFESFSYDLVRHIAAMEAGREIRQPARGHIMPVEVLPIDEVPDAGSLVAVIYSRLTERGGEEMTIRLRSRAPGWKVRAIDDDQSTWPPRRLDLVDLEADNPWLFLLRPPKTFREKLRWLFRKPTPYVAKWYAPIGWFALPTMRREMCDDCKKLWWVFGENAQYGPDIVAVCGDCARKHRPGMFSSKEVAP